MTYREARAGIHYHVNPPPYTRRSVRAIRHKYRVYDLQHPTRWYVTAWCALWLAWWVLVEAIRPQN
jgi:hypothetical protein